MTLWVAMLVSHLWSTSWVMFPVHLQNFCSGQGCQNWCRRETVGHCCSQGYSCLLDSCQQIFHAVSELRLEPPGTDMDKLVLESLFEVCCTFLTYYWTCEDFGPCTLSVVLQSVDQSILGNLATCYRVECFMASTC
jgi:hypothetical protein